MRGNSTFPSFFFWTAFSLCYVARSIASYQFDMSTTKRFHNHLLVQAKMLKASPPPRALYSGREGFTPGNGLTNVPAVSTPLPTYRDILAIENTASDIALPYHAAPGSAEEGRGKSSQKPPWGEGVRRR